MRHIDSDPTFKIYLEQLILNNYIDKHKQIYKNKCKTINRNVNKKKQLPITEESNVK